MSNTVVRWGNSFDKVVFPPAELELPVEGVLEPLLLLLLLPPHAVNVTASAVANTVCSKVMFFWFLITLAPSRYRLTNLY